MDFLEELFELDKHNYQKRDKVFNEIDHKGDDSTRRQYPIKSHTQGSTYHPLAISSPLTLLSINVCRSCSTQIVQGAKFCHNCGAGIEPILPCAGCGSTLPIIEPHCSQCGYRN